MRKEEKEFFRKRTKKKKKKKERNEKVRANRVCDGSLGAVHDANKGGGTIDVLFNNRGHGLVFLETW